MPDTKTFTISTATADGQVNPPLLVGQIRNSSMSQAAKDGLDTVDGNVSDDLLTIVFANTLDASDNTELDAVVAAHAGAVEISAKPQGLRSTAEQTTASGTFQTVATLSMQPVEGGLWQLQLSAEVSLENGADFSSGSPDRAAEYRLIVNGTTELAFTAWPFGAYSSWGALVARTLNAGAAPTFEVQMRRIGTADTAKIRRIGLLATRVAER